MLALFALVALCEASVPLFAWSDHKYFLSKESSHAKVTEFVGHEDFAQILASMISTKKDSSKLSSYVQDDAGSPSVVMSFVAPQMSSGQMASQTSLKIQAASSASTLSVSYAQPKEDTTFSEQISSAVNGKTILTSCAQLNSLDKSAFTDGVTDYLEVVDSNPDAACLEHATSMVSQATQGQYIAVFTADADNNAAFFLQADSTTTASTTGQSVEYITSDILVALIIMIPLVFLVIGAVMASMAIQAPPRMSKVVLQPTREY